MKNKSAPLKMERQSTSVRIADMLRERIMDGYFVPGQQINEVHVSNQLNLSRGPVREALQRLSQEGLLVSKPNRGVFVVEFTVDDAEEIHSARRILELGAAELITKQSPPSRLKTAKRLGGIAEKLAQAAVLGDKERVVRLDLEYYSALVTGCANSRILRAYTPLVAEALFCLTNGVPEYSGPTSPDHYKTMAQLIGTGSLTEIRLAL